MINTVCRSFNAVLTRSDVCLLAFVLGGCTPLLMTSLPPLGYLLVCLVVLILCASVVIKLRALVFLIAGCAWAVYQFSDHLQHAFPESLQRLDITLIGEVFGFPVRVNDNVRFTLIVRDVPGVPELSHLAGRRIQLNCYRCPLDVHTADKWRLTVRLKKPHGYASWAAVDYEKFLFRHRITARGYVRVADDNERLSRSISVLVNWRDAVAKTIRASGDGVGQAIILALVIGDKSGFSVSERQIFQDTGVSHLLAISGLHVGLVFLVVARLSGVVLSPMAGLFSRIPRQTLVLLPALTASGLYSALAGFSISTQRALVMLTVFVLCRLWAREASLRKVLMMAMCALLFFDPYAILDTGFWLSCFAVWVIASVDDGEQRLSLLGLQPRLWLGMLPASALFFGQISLVSPLVNLIAVPLFCLALIPATLLGVCMAQLGMTTLGGELLTLLSSVFTHTYSVLNWVASWPHARWYTVSLSGWHWGIIGLLVVGQLGARKWRVITGLVVAGSILFYSAPLPNRDELRVALLDVGQGLAMVIETADSVTVYDTGPRYASGFTTADAVLLPYLRARGVRKIDTLIISHADNDHIGGYPTLVKAFEVGQVITSRTDKVPDSRECVQGQSWRYNLTHFEMLSPADGTPTGSNNRSCVLKITHFDSTLLLSGDIEKPVERYLLQQQQRGALQLQADILLIPHQGSKTSSTPEFIQAVDPQLALVAAGFLNHYGHPHPKVIERYQQQGVPVMSTIEHGSVLISINAGGWTITSYRASEQRFWHYQKVSNQTG